MAHLLTVSKVSEIAKKVKLFANFLNKEEKDIIVEATFRSAENGMITNIELNSDNKSYHLYGKDYPIKVSKYADTQDITIVIDVR
jgi:hypothetical protein